jgi:hypothetical protein
VTAIDDARAALHAAQEHIGHATTILYACHQGAGQIIQQATQLGASGVANNVAGLRKHAGHAASQVDRLIATTHAVLRGGRPEPMVAKLTDAKTHLETVAQQSQIAGDKAQQTQGAVTVLGNF